MSKLRFEFQSWLCEVFTSWAIAVCPANYTPSYVRAGIDLYNAGYKKGRAGIFCGQFMDITGPST